MLDDSLPENTASGVLDDTLSSLRAVEGNLASPSRRAPAHTMLDDGALQKPPIGDARWYAVRKHVLLKVLDNLLSVLSRVESAGEHYKNLARLCLTTSRRRVHHRTVLDDHIRPRHGRGWCLTAGGHRAPLEGVLDSTAL
jgi:hypothetical protein